MRLVLLICLLIWAIIGPCPSKAFMVHPSIWKRQDERAFLSPKTDIEKVEQRQSLATLAKLSNPRTRREMIRQLLIMRKMINLRHHIPMINSVLRLLTKIQRNSNTLESKIRF
eukprot:13711.XXX_878529_878033_1 [CDS] Oithona nana genome sequencing.